MVREDVSRRKLNLYLKLEKSKKGKRKCVTEETISLSKPRKNRKEEEYMINMIKEAKDEIIRLEKANKIIDKQLQNLTNVPEGCLKYQNVKGKTYYYHQFVETENEILKNSNKYNTNTADNNISKVKIEYIKRDSTLAKELANKQYYTKLKVTVRNNLNQLKRFINKYQENKIDEIYDSLSDERKRLVTPLQLSIKEQVRIWDEEEYEKNNSYPENLRYETDQGDLVRSKSEVIIANILYKHRKDIIYKYEKPLSLVIDGRERQVHPDFSIINIHTGRITYWEHAGLMDDAHYATEFVRKMNAYVYNGLIPGKDVIVSYETQELPLDIGVVKKMVNHITEI